MRRRTWTAAHIALALTPPLTAQEAEIMAAQAVDALETIRSRNLPPLEPSVVTVGLIRGGTRLNIIPDRTSWSTRE